jgi:hypothetical protein
MFNYHFFIIYIINIMTLTRYFKLNWKLLGLEGGNKEQDKNNKEEEEGEGEGGEEGEEGEGEGGEEGEEGEGGEEEKENKGDGNEEPVNNTNTIIPAEFKTMVLDMIKQFNENNSRNIQKIITTMTESKKEIIDKLLTSQSHHIAASPVSQPIINVFGPGATPNSNYPNYVQVQNIPNEFGTVTTDTEASEEPDQQSPLS